MPQSVDYVIDPFLTKLAKNYTNTGFISDVVAPRLDVESEYGWYMVGDKTSFRIESDLRSGIARANRVDYQLSLAKYGPLLEHSLEQGVTDREKGIMGDSVALQRATTNVMSKIMLNHEFMVASMFQDPTIITQSTTASGTSQWNDAANTSMFTDIQSAWDQIDTNGFDVNGMKKVMVIGYQAWSAIRNLTQLINRLSTASTRTPLTTQQLEALFDVDQIIVSNVKYDTAKEGQTPSLSYVWGKNVLLMYVPTTGANGNAGISQISPMYTLQLNNPGGGTMSGRYVDRWIDQAQKTEFVRANDYFQPYLVAPELAYLYKNVIR